MILFLMMPIKILMTRDIFYTAEDIIIRKELTLQQKYMLFQLIE